MRTLATVVLSAGLALLAFGCREEPVRPSRPRETVRAGEQRRAHAVTTPGTVGSLEGASFYIEVARDRPDAEVGRPILVEEDARRREVGFAYLPAAIVLGFVDRDVVVVSTKDSITCYDVARHETRWDHSFADTGRSVDDFVRRGEKLDVTLEGGGSMTLDLATGQKAVP